MSIQRFLVCVTSGVVLCSNAWAWSDHSVLTRKALQVMPLVENAKPVLVESLPSFLRSEQAGIAKLNKQQDEWATKNIESYPPIPNTLLFPASGDFSDKELIVKFEHALRISTSSKLPLYLKRQATESRKGIALLPPSDITPVPHDLTPGFVFERINPGQMVSVLDVVSSAADEPDNGLDFNLWSDNPGPDAALYQFGKQPFGNAAIDYATQAPFHMGFYHESAIVYKLAPFVGRTYPELRAYQYATLSDFAFKTGHTYWGWRFLGWSLHYLQDLGQPYHASLAPNLSLPKMLFINFLTMIGFPQLQNDAIVLLSNRHLSLESYQSGLFRDGAKDGKDVTLLTDALQDTKNDSNYPSWNFDFPVKYTSTFAHEHAQSLDGVVAASFSKDIVDNPKKSFISDVGLYKKVSTETPDKNTALRDALIPLMQNVGSSTRDEVQGVLSKIRNDK